MGKWHCTINGTKYGPVSAEELRKWVAEGRFAPTDYVWSEGMADWAPFNTIAELNSGSAPPVATGAYAQAPIQTAPQPGNGMAVAGMVLGIVSVPFICFWPIGLVCAIVGLCLSVLGKNRAREINVGEGMAIAGLVLSCVTLALIAILLIAGISCMSQMNNYFRNLPRPR
ncbi:MAG: GYF domain-containing protein [Phycisphaerae bacterium]|jgi:hypothetical protein|nr:GYF domain-containing protein [Phycisphaerae bacterium]